MSRARWLRARSALRLAPLVLCFFFVACAGPEAAPAPSVPVVASVAPKPTPAATSSRCPAIVDVGDLLARHARAYGSPESVAAALPMSMTGTLELQGKTGKVETIVTAKELRSQLWIAGVRAAAGIDASGAWILENGAGVVERQTPDEAIDTTLDAWLARRSYVTAFQPANDAARCTDGIAEIGYARHELGKPALSFDLQSAALVSVVHTQVSGRQARVTYEAWSDADHGVRWPRKTSDHPATGNASATELVTFTRGLECSRFDATGVAIPERGAACTTPPAERFSIRWPTGSTVVRLPFVYLGGELLLKAKIGGREVFAFLDSGASMSVVDATTRAGKEFQPALEAEGLGATQAVRFGFGELASVDVGDLHAEHLPVASAPIPGLDAFGDKRPELILGYSFFASAAVRVDYTNGQIALGRSADGLFAKNALLRSIPLRIWKSMIIADGVVEGIAAPFQVDTGDAGVLDLYAKWASVHGLPGTRPVSPLKGHFGVGDTETTSQFYRLGKASLGPIDVSDHVSNVGDPPAGSIIAGLAGNETLARCDAVVFDVAKRTLWLEGKCDLPVPEYRLGWRLQKTLDPALPDRPWVVAGVFIGGAADRAGIQVGDRVLEVGGKPATLDIAPIWAIDRKATGTKVPLLVTRAGAPKNGVRVIAELRPIVP